MCEFTKGYSFHLFAPVSHCYGGNSCCSKYNKCNEGEGDCDDDEDCVHGHCGADNCPAGSTFTMTDDCCLSKPIARKLKLKHFLKKKSPSPLSTFLFSEIICTGQGGCCTKERPCKPFEGDCDSDDDCQGSSKCGTNNCDTDRYPSFSDQDDCCKESTRSNYYS